MLAACTLDTDTGDTTPAYNTAEYEYGAWASDGGIWAVWEIPADHEVKLHYGKSNDFATAEKWTGTVEHPRAGVFAVDLTGLDNGMDYYLWFVLTGTREPPEPLIVRPEAAKPIPADGQIATGGIYRLPDAPSTGPATNITVSTRDSVTLVGSGIGDGIWNNSGVNVTVNCITPGANLILKDAYIGVDSNTASPLISFTGSGNTLTITGKNLMERKGTGNTQPGMVYVPVGAELTVGGYGTLYFYKQGQGAGFGGSGTGGSNPLNGKLTFKELTMFGKSTHPGPSIGSSAIGEPGDITFLSGEYNLIGNSSAAIIGGGHGTSEGDKGGRVFIKGGVFNLNVDYSGAAIGGGGFKSGGNDGLGGWSLFVTGGSLRTYLDRNAVIGDNPGSTEWYKGGIHEEGVYAEAITANIAAVPGGGKLRLVKFDTRQVSRPHDGIYTVTIDGQPFYNGGLHKWHFINESRQKGDQLPINSTLDNWAALGDETNLYFYVSMAPHTLTVNGRSFPIPAVYE